MKHFGKRTLVLWYSTDSDYYDISNDESSWRDNSGNWIRVSKPFNVEIIQRVSAAEEINKAKVANVDEKIAAARALLETLKGERANLLAITHEVSS